MSESIITAASAAEQVLRGKSRTSVQPFGLATAYTNVALVKYWGKRNEELHLPYCSSISFAMRGYGTATKISYETTVAHDRFFLNEKEIALKSSFAKRLTAFLDLFRAQGEYFHVVSNSNIPLAAGCASSASGFAALVLALNNFYGWGLWPHELSILARLGSGSAARSVFAEAGAVAWNRGQRADGSDSYGVPLAEKWPELRVGLLLISTKSKKISSSEAMQRTVATAPSYKSWCEATIQDLTACMEALRAQDFASLGKVIERNSAALHQLLQDAHPAINYTAPATTAVLAKVRALRTEGLEIYATQDAGPNLQLIFQAQDEKMVTQLFPGIKIAPVWEEVLSEELVLVDERDRVIGAKDKLSVHRDGDLHRAFSVILWRAGAAEPELLLQQRSSSKYHSANLWSNSCCGHPRPGEELLNAAKRRLSEELGVSCELTAGPVVTYRAEVKPEQMVESEVDHLFFGEITALPQNYNTLEVQNCRWVTLSTLQRELARNPQQYTAWLPFLVNHIINKTL